MGDEKLSDGVHVFGTDAWDRPVGEKCELGGGDAAGAESGDGGGVGLDVGGEGRGGGPLIIVAPGFERVGNPENDGRDKLHRD